MAARRAVAGAGARGGAALLLAVCVALVAAAPARAGKCKSVASSAQPFTTQMQGGAPKNWSGTPPRRGPAVNYLDYCFQVVRGAGACSDADCCGADVRLTAFYLATDAKCRGSAAERKVMAGMKWTANGSPAPKAKIDSKTGELRVPMPKGLEDGGKVTLCVSVPDSAGVKKKSSCPTIQDICPSGCTTRLDTGKFGSSSSKPSACCAVQAAPALPPNTTSPSANTTTGGGAGGGTGGGAPTDTGACKAGQGGAGCAACAAGTYSEGGTLDDPRPECTPCPDGTTTLGSGGTSEGLCACKAGRGGASCAPCPAGSWSSGGALGDLRPNCTACDIGLSTLAEGQNSSKACVACAPGYGGPSCDLCSAGTFSAGGTTGAKRPACTACAAGLTTAEAGKGSSDSCSVCKAGFGGPSCAICPAGGYSLGGTATNPRPFCVKCPTGLATLTNGSTSNASCVVCAAGYGGPDCALCPYNTYSAGGSAIDPTAFCVACPTGTYTAYEGSKSPIMCLSPNTITCKPGYLLADNACHQCPKGSYSPGGTVDTCSVCPTGTTTDRYGAASLSECKPPSGAPPDTAFAWTKSSTEALGQQCRTDLTELFALSAWDDAIAAKLSLAASCEPLREGLLEIHAIYESGILDGKAAALFAASQSGDLALDWQTAVGASTYERVWGDIGVAKVADQTAVAGLEAVYASEGYKIVPGPLLKAVKGLPEDKRATVMSLVTGVVEERRATAYSYFGGQMSAARAVMWLLARRMKDEVEALVPGVYPSEVVAESDVRWVTLNLPPPKKSQQGVASAQGAADEPTVDGDGMREISMVDMAGNWRNLLCFTGLHDNGYRASKMALQGFGNRDACITTVDSTTAMETDVSYTKSSNDEEHVTNLAASLEVHASTMGVNVGLGASYESHEQSASQSVYVTAMATKLGAAPISLPDKVPGLTTEAMTILLGDNGVDKFRQTFGTHFILGFKMGGYISFHFELVSNQRTSKESIKAKLDASDKAGIWSASASFDMDKEFKSNGVDVKKKAHTNTLLPLSCAMAAMGDEFVPQDTRDCIKDWFDLPPTAAYSAYAVPYNFHPDYQNAIAQIATSSSSNTGRRLAQDAGTGGALSTNTTDTVPIGDSEVDYRFKDTGLLQMRLTRIQNTLDNYKVKEDAFFLQAQQAVEAAKGVIDDILSGLRNRSIVSVADWQPMYRTALGLVHVASLKSDFTPRGAKCGWCTRTTKRNTNGNCTVSCASTLQCSVKGDGCPATCLPRGGFSYESVITTTGVIVPTCKLGITGQVCEEYGTQDQDLSGGYHCKQNLCIDGREYCDGEEVIVNGNVTACMGNCTVLKFTDALSSQVNAGIQNCISSADKDDKSKNYGCVYSENRLFGACMAGDGGTQFTIFDLRNPSQRLPLSTYQLRDAFQDPASPSQGPFTACMRADGDFVIEDALGSQYFESRTGVFQGATSPFRAKMENTGNFAIYDSSNPTNRILWETGSAPNWMSSTAFSTRDAWYDGTAASCLRVASRTVGLISCMPSPSRNADVCLHWDGNIVIYGGGVTTAWQPGVNVLWTSGSNAPAGATYPIYLCIELNGNLRAVDKDARSIFWQSGTGTQGTSALFRATLADGGAFTVADATGAVQWTAAMPSTPAGSPIRLIAVNTMVVHVDSYDSGTPAEIQTFQNNNVLNQLWTQAADGSLVVVGGSSDCLEVANDATTSGSPVQIADCNGAPRQKWFRDTSGTSIRPYHAMNMCLHAATGAAGQVLTISSCIPGLTNQQWTATFIAVLKELVAVPNTNNLVVMSQDTLSPTPAIVGALNGGATQQWVHDSSYDFIKLTTMNLCLGIIQGSLTVAGLAVNVLTCNSTTAATNMRWFRHSDGSLRVFSALQLCLEMAPYPPVAGTTKLQLGTCSVATKPAQNFTAGFVRQSFVGYTVFSIIDKNAAGPEQQMVFSSIGGSAGSAMEVRAFTGSDVQLWQPWSSGNQIKLKGSGNLCLAIPSWITYPGSDRVGDGTQLQIQPCTVAGRPARFTWMRNQAYSSTSYCSDRDGPNNYGFDCGGIAQSVGGWEHFNFDTISGTSSWAWRGGRAGSLCSDQGPITCNTGSLGQWETWTIDVLSSAESANQWSNAGTIAIKTSRSDRPAGSVCTTGGSPTRTYCNGGSDESPANARFTVLMAENRAFRVTLSGLNGGMKGSFRYFNCNPNFCTGGPTPAWFYDNYCLDWAGNPAGQWPSSSGALTVHSCTGNTNQNITVITL